MRNTILTATLLLSLLAASGTALAEENQAMNHESMSGMHSMQPATAQGNIGVGTVNRVDIQNGKVNLTHGPIKTLGWPGMTMDFTVKDPAILNGINAGQKVAFEVVKEGPGRYYVAQITPLK